MGPNLSEYAGVEFYYSPMGAVPRGPERKSSVRLFVARRKALLHALRHWEVGDGFPVWRDTGERGRGGERPVCRKLDTRCVYYVSGKQ